MQPTCHLGAELFVNLSRSTGAAQYQRSEFPWAFSNRRRFCESISSTLLNLRCSSIAVRSFLNTRALAGSKMAARVIDGKSRAKFVMFPGRVCYLRFDSKLRNRMAATTFTLEVSRGSPRSFFVARRRQRIQWYAVRPRRRATTRASGDHEPGGKHERFRESVCVGECARRGSTASSAAPKEGFSLVHNASSIRRVNLLRGRGAVRTHLHLVVVDRLWSSQARRLPSAG